MINTFNEIADLAGVNRIEPDLSGREAMLATKECEADLEKARNIVVEENESWFEEYFAEKVYEGIKDHFEDAYEGWIENLTLEEAQQIASKKPEPVEGSYDGSQMQAQNEYDSTEMSAIINSMK